MIDPDYCRLLARYNRWMNERLYALVGAMDPADRTRDRGAFFGSIERTLSHLVWADRAWLGRFVQEPYAEPGYGADLYTDFDVLRRERDNTDAAILDWTANLTQQWLDGALRYTRKADGRTVSLPAWIAVTHFFNHSTHHRGQVTTLMKQAGVDPGVTDLPWMPGVSAEA
ncbi:MAG TPA: DinB family protein [Casimicrobiaceae bacterium]|nr:DinB family protein [Casimicrobiaceae bacterium]